MAQLAGKPKIRVIKATLGAGAYAHALSPTESRIVVVIVARIN
jgi:hypothetical protein